MPSKKEGFGIIFIEAMYYGLPVIAGKADGSVDALRNGQLGLLVDPEDQQEIDKALAKVLGNLSSFVPDKVRVMQEFGYDSYKHNLKKILDQALNNS